MRRAYNKRLDYLKDHEKEAVKLQAHWKGFKQRTAYKERKELLANSVHIIIKVGGKLCGRACACLKPLSCSTTRS